ncbi:DNA polymerase III subunit chi [Novosphingobium sp.]|uniref:DNA polymerase III subunit chi n=1 Tax=Novosphingobium sp. TaxID=1874826 RepID=UPI0025D7739A|nr:DNA polymerase III subunit chi [Novosphingobium sp.]MCC6925322.1 DNA polymerase III subunit chi [Novosphingobium sp.]
MRVDFYQLSQSSLEEALPALAAKMLGSGARVLVVSADEAQLARVSAALWAVKDQFLAHAPAGGPHDARQPILLSHSLDAANGASFLALADGQWREGADAFERVFLLFDGSSIDDARATWRMLGEREGVEKNYWRQEGKGWVKAA